MKKILSLIIITFCSILLVGCGKKNLKCSLDISSTAAAGISGQMQIDANFKNDKIEDVTMQMNFELDESRKSIFDTYMSTMESTYKNQYSGDHVNVSSEKTGDLTFNIKITMDFKNMTAEEKKKVGFGEGSESYSINKADLEREGYTCK